MGFSAALIQHQAYDVRSAEEGLERVLSLIDQAAAARPSLVVLPECSYPGYYLGLHGDPPLTVTGWKNALARFREKARDHAVHLVAGIAEDDGGYLYNSAYLIGPDGSIMGRARKSFLWHFDSNWFMPGDEYRVFDTALGKIGMIVCADGRLPEISRVLAIKGAEIIVDPTNWVASAKTAESLRNPQVDYMIPTRALENGVWFLCANKVGREAESIAYCGQSIIVSPDGTTQVKGSPNAEEIITGQVEVDPADRQKAMNIRREHVREEYGLLTVENNRTPLASILDVPVYVEKSICQLAIAQLDRDISLQEFLQTSVPLARRAAGQGANVIVFPEVPVTVMRDFAEQVKNALLPVSMSAGVHIAVTLKGNPRAVTTLLDPRGGVTTVGDDHPVIDIGGTRFGFLRGVQGFIPEEARILFLKGADVVVWQTNSSVGREKEVCVTRALENRVYVALANCVSKDSPRNSVIVAPSGQILAETFPSSRQIAAAQVSPAESRVKRVVRGTDVFRNRLPQLYGALQSM